MARERLTDRQIQEINALRAELDQRDLEIAELTKEAERLDQANYTLRSQLDQIQKSEPQS
jgi:hypothetical protein